MYSSNKRNVTPYIVLPLAWCWTYFGAPNGSPVKNLSPHLTNAIFPVSVNYISQTSTIPEKQTCLSVGFLTVSESSPFQNEIKKKTTSMLADPSLTITLGKFLAKPPFRSSRCRVHGVLFGGYPKNAPEPMSHPEVTGQLGHPNRCNKWCWGSCPRKNWPTSTFYVGEQRISKLPARSPNIIRKVVQHLGNSIHPCIWLARCSVDTPTSSFSRPRITSKNRETASTF